jgi:hypothetical protein
MTPDASTNVQLRTHVFTTPLREFGTDGKHWSPCASTLVIAATEAVLTDTGHIKSEVSALGDMIKQTGKRLTTIYITHGHLDHFLGIGQLMERFPSARPVAAAAVVADIKSSVAEQEKQWQTRFGDDVDKTAVIPEPLEGDVIDLEGHELRVIEVPQGDISQATRRQRPGSRNDPRRQPRLHPRLSRRRSSEQHRPGGHRNHEGEIPRLRKPHHTRVLRRRSVPRRVGRTTCPAADPPAHTDRRGPAFPRRRTFALPEPELRSARIRGLADAAASDCVPRRRLLPHSECRELNAGMPRADSTDGSG